MYKNDKGLDYGVKEIIATVVAGMAPRRAKVGVEHSYEVNKNV